LNNYDEKKLKIDKQIARWELYAKLAPVCFIIISTILILTNCIEITTLYYISICLTAITVIIWWIWSIYTVRYVINKMTNASEGLYELKLELEEIKKNMIKPPNLD